MDRPLLGYSIGKRIAGIFQVSDESFLLEISDFQGQDRFPRNPGEPHKFRIGINAFQLFVEKQECQWCLLKNLLIMGNINHVESHPDTCKQWILLYLGWIP